MPLVYDQRNKELKNKKYFDIIIKNREGLKMAKINITKPTGNVESLNILSAFKAENNIYVVLDSEKMGSMGLPIIYVSKYTSKLEKINDTNEWQSVKNYLKGIISGTNFEYVKLGENIIADEAYYTPLTLPASSFDAIKARYIVEDVSTEGYQAPTLTPVTPEVTPVMPNTNTVSNTTINVTPVTPSPVTPAESQSESVMNLIDEAYKVSPVQPSPALNVGNKEMPTGNNIPPAAPIASTPEESMPVSTNMPKSPVEEPKVMPSTTPTNIAREPKSNTMNFDNDKETFLKACENMFDALVSKYQKELDALEIKKQELAQKEAEINAKLKNANEHLANAEAREQVANIAHDNAKRVMDLNNFMPVNPNNPVGN